MKKNNVNENLPKDHLPSDHLPSDNLPSDQMPKDDVTNDNLPNENATSDNSQNKKSKGKKIKFNIFNPFKNSYKQLKTDEKKKNKSVLFGLLAILFSCVCVGMCYPCVWLGVKGVVYAFTHNFGVFTYIFGLANIIIAAFSVGFMCIPYYFWLQGVRLVIMQFCLNRRIVSWLALLFWLASVAGILFFSIESFAHFVGVGTVWLFK